MKFLIAFVALASLSQAEVFDRPCRTAEQLGVKSGFLPAQYTGIWYEIERYEQVFQANGDCVTAQYTANPNGSINVFNQAFLINEDRFISDTGLAILSFPDENPLRAKLNVTFFPEQPSTSNYWVLSTDYFGYAFVVSCFNLPENRSNEAFWLLSRSRQISAAGRTRADELITLHLDRSRIRHTNQNDVDCRRIPGRV